jgi:hypothetical protein
VLRKYINYCTYITVQIFNVLNEIIIYTFPTISTLTRMNILEFEEVISIT